MSERSYYHFSAIDPNCPSRELLNLIADKWTVLIIEVLMNGTIRYGEIKREVGNISDKMLSQTLRKLEDRTLVKRTMFPEVPPHVEYQLTPLGKSLADPLHALVTWAEKNQAQFMDQ